MKKLQSVEDKLLENIDYSKEWIIQEMIRTSIRQKGTKREEIIRIKKIDLLNLILKFIKLNERGE